jgi:hypothetical protein
MVNDRVYGRVKLGDVKGIVEEYITAEQKTAEEVS